MEQGEEARRETAGVGAARAYELVRKELFGEFGADFYRLLHRPAAAGGRVGWRAAVPGGLADRQGAAEPTGPASARARACGSTSRASQAIEILLEHEIPEDVRALADARIEEARAPAAGAGASAVELTFDTFCRGRRPTSRAYTVAQMIARRRRAWRSRCGSSIRRPAAARLTCSTPIAHEARMRAPDRKVLMMTGQEYLEQLSVGACTRSAIHRRSRKWSARRICC